MSNFEIQSSFEVEYAPVKITKWRSRRTGLMLTYINDSSPLVECDIVVGIKASDNSGCAYAVQHLTSFGSKKYPYKGFLETLGPRLFTNFDDQGINAYTTKDRSVYMLRSVGWEGLCRILPVQLDHIFNPCLTEEAFLTEVYHVDGDGHENGVLFKDAQDHYRYNVMDIEYYRTFYPEDSGYSYEPTGISSEIRKLTLSRIRKFHRETYKPENVGIVITGSVDERELLHTVEAFEAELPAAAEAPHKRPWINPQIETHQPDPIVREIKLPEDDESNGEILMGWIGPPRQDQLSLLASEMVASYMEGQPSSLLDSALVEAENPSASYIQLIHDYFSPIAVNLFVHDVPVGELYNVEQKIRELISNSAEKSLFDLERMRKIIRREKSTFENEDSSLAYTNIAMDEVLYGSPDGSDLEDWVAKLRAHEELAAWSSEQWMGFINTFFVNSKSVTLIGKPSREEKDAYEEERRKNSETSEMSHGKEDLEKFNMDLIKAREINEAAIPDEVLDRFIRPGTSNINFLRIDNYKVGNGFRGSGCYKTDDSFFNALYEDTPSEFPLSIHIENYLSRHVKASIVFSLLVLPPELLSYIAIIRRGFPSSVKKPDGLCLSSEEVNQRLEEDLVELWMEIEPNRGLASAKFEFGVENYGKAIDWMTDLLKYSIFEESEVKRILEELVQETENVRRSEFWMVDLIQGRKLYETSSLQKFFDPLLLKVLYEEMIQKIHEGEFSEIEENINLTKRILFNATNCRIFLRGGCSKLENPISAWSSFGEEIKDPVLKKEVNLQKTPQLGGPSPKLQDFCLGEAFVNTTPDLKGGRLVLKTRIPKDFSNEDASKLSLAIEFSKAWKGPIRRGLETLERHIFSSISEQDGFLTISIQGTTALQQAFIIAKDIVLDLSSGAVKTKQTDLDKAYAGVVASVVYEVDNWSSAALKKIENIISEKEVLDQPEVVLKSLNAISEEDLKDAITKFMVPLFDPKTSLVFSALPKDSAPGFTEFLKEWGYKVNLEEL